MEFKNSEVYLYAKSKHSGQFRQGGDEYITHPVAVAKMLMEKDFNVNFVNTALLHDCLEDTNATELEILELTNKEVLTAVKLLTKEKNYSEEIYFERICNNELAKIVKLADRIHNLESAVVTNRDFRRRYIIETREHFLSMAKKTVFEKEMKLALQKLEKTI